MRLDLGLLGGAADRPFRNRLETRRLAKRCADWIDKNAEVRRVSGIIPQAALIATSTNDESGRAIIGNCPFTTPDVDAAGEFRPIREINIVRWRQELIKDRERLATLHAAAVQVLAARDAKLNALRDLIEGKAKVPLNPGNRKVIVFTAFADTAQYLYE